MKGIAEKAPIVIPVTSVNNKTGEIILSYEDVNAPKRDGTNATGTWDINATHANNLNVTLWPTQRENNAAGYRLIGTSAAGTWNNKREVWVIASRHTGCGLLCFNFGHNSAETTLSAAYAEIIYYGPKDKGSVFYEDGFQIYYNATSQQWYLFWKYVDYNSTAITRLAVGGQGGWSIIDGADMDSINTSTYGTCICKTTVK